MNTLLTESKKKVFTIPEGEYTGTWQDGFCCIHDDDKKVFARVETKTKSKKRLTVKIIVQGVNFKIYGRNL